MDASKSYDHVGFRASNSFYAWKELSFWHSSALKRSVDPCSAALSSRGLHGTKSCPGGISRALYRISATAWSHVTKLTLQALSSSLRPLNLAQLWSPPQARKNILRLQTAKAAEYLKWRCWKNRDVGSSELQNIESERNLGYWVDRMAFGQTIFIKLRQIILHENCMKSARFVHKKCS